jgi:NAD(P)-dependent dehydrogenase (short-subunit alcohol dehydrogenase family)
MLGVRACNAAVPHLRKAGGGSIVLTAAYSIRGLAPYLMPYVAMKAAVAALSKNLAISLGPDKIRVNCVAPGAIATEALDGAKSQAVEQYGGSVEEALGRMMREQWKMDVALGRAGEPRELGELYAFLLSDKAGYLTGAVINQDGGTKF